MQKKNKPFLVYGKTAGCNMFTLEKPNSNVIMCRSQLFVCLVREEGPEKAFSLM